MYFAPLRFSRQEWSVAPSIFNIIEQGLAYCHLWMTLSQEEVYDDDSWALMALSGGRVCKKYLFGISDTITGTCTREINTIEQYKGL